MNHFPRFRSALRAWAFRLWDDMKHDVSSVRTLAYVPSRSGGDAIGTLIDLPPQRWPDKYNSGAFYLPEWAEVVKAWHEDEHLKAHYMSLVGWAGMRSAVVEPELGFAFWPTMRLAAHWRIGCDPKDVRDQEFTILYEPVEQFFADEHREIVVLLPLSGLVTDGPCELEKGVVLDRFDRDEIQLLVNRGIISGRFGSSITADNVEEAQRHGLRRNVRVQKIVGDAIDLDEAEELARILSQPSDDRLRILRSLACCLDEAVIPQPFVGRTLGWNPGGGERGSPSPIFPYSGWGVSKALLTRGDHDSMRRMWAAFGQPTFEQSGSLRIAVDRIAWRGTRPSSIDVLVDVAIASEAFFRSGEPQNIRPSKGQKVESSSARVKRRAAEYIDGFDYSMNSEEVRLFFHAAFEIRNQVVHRGEHPSVVLDGRGTSLEFSEFVERYAALMRRALLRHLTEREIPESPSW